jgi:WD40 repeat protein
MIKSPFKFLDSYTLEDRDIFFGRYQEITELYRKVFESKILLVYGVSGTGKSSLINCGLASRLDESDWLSVNIRRGNNIIDSLNDAINKQALTSFKTNLTIGEKLRSIYLDHFKPVYLIFDQFEELFIFGDKEERKSFIQVVKSLIESDIQCRMIFIMREEYMAGVTEFERYIPTFFANRVRIEKMSQVNAMEAIKGPCKVAGINLEEGFAESLLEKISPEGADVELTYLQVFLDKIFRLASDNYPPLRGGQGGADYPSQEGFKVVSFTLDLLQKTGNVSDLLGSFLDEQISLLNNPDIGLAVLKSFVSIKGTKRQMTSEEVKEYTKTLGKTIEDSALIEMLQTFIHLRILRDKDQNERYELRHDGLAEKIYDKFTAIEKDIIEVRQFIDNAFHYWQKRGELLSQSDLEYISPYESRLYLPREVSGLIETSKRELVRVKHRRRNIVVTAAIALLVIFAGFAIWALKERENALFQQTRAIDSRNKAVESEKMAVEAKDKALASEKKSREQELLATNAKELALKSEKLAVEAKNKALASEKKAIESELIAANAREQAFEAKRQADLEKERAVEEARRSKVLLLVTKAREASSINPTKAIRYSQLAYKYDSSSLLVNQTFSDVFHNADSKPFYTVSMDPVFAAVFSPDGQFILTVPPGEKTVKLWDLAGNCKVTFLGHTDYVGGAIFTPDGKNILTISDDKTAKLWDLSGKCLTTFLGHSDYVASAVFSLDGKSILTASNDKTAKLWDLSGKCLANFSGHKGLVNSATFSPTGKNILTASADKTAKLWDLSGNCLTTFTDHTEYVRSAIFSPDGKNILTASGDKTAKLWDLSGKCLATLTGHTEDVRSAVFSPDGKNILTASRDKTAKLWDLSGKCLATFTGHTEYIWSAVFSPDGKYILTASGDNTAKLWDPSGICLATFMGHTGALYSAVFSPDCQTVLTVSADKTAKLWDLSKKYLVTFSGHTQYVRASIFSPDGKNILTASGDKTVKIWDLSGRCLATFSGHTGPVNSCIFSPDGKYILTASVDKTAKLWDLSGKCLATLAGHTNSLNSAVFSPDGKNILSASNDNTAKLWDLSGRCLYTYQGPGRVYSAVFSPDGKNFLIAASEWRAILCDLSGKLLVTFNATMVSSSIMTAIFSPNGKIIFTASSDAKANLWDQSGKKIASFVVFPRVNTAVFSSDGKNILTSYLDAKLWDMSGKCLVTLSGYTGNFTSAVFSPDDKNILTASSDKTAKLWDLSGKCLVTYSTGSLNSVVFSPDGKYFLTASSDKTAKLWSIPSSINKWLENAKIGTLSPADKVEVDEMDDFKTLQLSNDLSQITEYAKFYLNSFDTTKAVILFEKVLKTSPGYFNKKILGDIYRRQNEREKYTSLYINEPEQIILDDISALKDTSEVNRPFYKHIFYLEKAKLFEKLLILDPSSSNKSSASVAYNGAAWYGLLAKEYTASLKAIQRAIELDSLSWRLYTCLAPAYLLNDQYENAKVVYLKYKDMPLEGKTYKERFLADISDLEKVGNKHPDFEKVKELLKK